MRDENLVIIGLAGLDICIRCLHASFMSALVTVLTVGKYPLVGGALTQCVDSEGARDDATRWLQ